mgnify:CR=1 FL=1
MDTESKNGLMEQYMKESGLTTKLKEKEHFGMLKETFTQDNSKLIKLMALVFIHMLMVQDMKETGLMMSKRVKARKLGSMVPNMSENIEME